MGRAWTREDAARRLLYFFIGKQPGDLLHVSDVSLVLGRSGGGFDDILAAVSYAHEQKWIRFDGERIELLATGFAQPL